VSFLLGTGQGILFLTVVACAFVVGSTMLGAILTLAALVGAIHMIRRLREL
jgi:hypothetical protein